MRRGSCSRKKESSIVDGVKRALGLVHFFSYDGKSAFFIPNPEMIYKPEIKLLNK